MNFASIKAFTEKRPLLTFLLVWLALCLILGYAGILEKRPVGIHQWAQCDRGSVARNYADESMNFFLPRVNASKNGPGVSGMEFPLMNYLAGVLYKIFGFHEMWYRLLMLLAISCSAWYAFLLSKGFVKDQLLALSMVILWYVSPVLVYYSPNFVPDTASLAFMMIAWYWYFKLLRNREDKGQRRAYLMLFLFASLASLIKITSFMGMMIMAGVAIVEFILPHKRGPGERRQLIRLVLTTVAVAAITFAWYFYADQLNKIYKTPYFLMSSNPVLSFRQAQWVIGMVSGLWLKDYYSIWSLIAGVLMFAVCLLNYRWVNRRLLLICLFYLAGIVSFFILMGIQFHHHDYYIITLLPFPFFVLLTFIEMVQRKYSLLSLFPSFRIIFIIIVLIAVVSNVIYARNKLSDRYRNAEKDSARFFGMEEYLRGLGIGRDDKVIVIYDCSPNITLYYFNVKGWYICQGDGDESMLQTYAYPDARYLITNDNDSFDLNFFMEPYIPYVVTSEGDTIDVSHPAPLRLIGRKNGYSVYRKIGNQDIR